MAESNLKSAALARLKFYAELVIATGVVWGAISSAVVYAFEDKVVRWADARYDQRYMSLAAFDEFEERFNAYELRQACQDTETKRDQIQRIINQLDPNTTPEAVMKDYLEDFKKYDDRFVEWGCRDVLETIPVIVRS